MHDPNYILNTYVDLYFTLTSDEIKKIPFDYTQLLTGPSQQGVNYFMYNGMNKKSSYIYFQGCINDFYYIQKQSNTIR